MQTEQEQIEHLISNSIGYFVTNIDVTEATFPLMKLTYSLWRKSAYQAILSKFSQKKQQVTYRFFLLSERKFLTQFIDKIQAQMNKYYRGLSDVQNNFSSQAISPKQEKTYELTLLLGQSMWEQQLYLQLIEDLIHLPYIQIFPKNTSLLVRQEYRTNFTSKKQKQKFVDKVCDKVTQTFFKKTLSTITEFFFTKAFVFQIQTLLGTFNPIMMGASYGLSQYMSSRGEKMKEEELVIDLENALGFSRERVTKLKQNYEKCLSLLNLVLSGQCEVKSKTKELRKLYLTFYEEQWLQIQVQQEGEWEVVHITEKEEFQDLITQSITEDDIK